MAELYLGLDELRASPELKRDLQLLMGQFVRKTRHHDALIYTTIWFPDEMQGRTSYVVRARLAANGDDALYATNEDWDIEVAIDKALRGLATQLRGRLLFLQRRDHELNLVGNVA